MTAMTDLPPVFYFGAMSPYSWISAERIDGVLPDARWSGVLLGAVFKANDRTSWGTTDMREQGIADCEARAAAHGLGTIVWPDPWPTSDLQVARALTYAESLGKLREYALSAMRLAFREGRDPGERDNVIEAGARIGIDAGELARALDSQAVKDALRASTERTIARGVFGVPTFAVGEQLFWGDDRLEDAAAAQHALSA
jgi:2-hydroxychromene-2-carboxylate isomerase